jgi:sulfite reductase (ferredoxin)
MCESKPVKESKAQRAERLKVEKNPWKAFDEVRRFAAEGRASVTPEWAAQYFKWWGIYTQGDGAGVVGGKGGEGVTSEYFLMRIGIPNGILTSAQLRLIGSLTQKYARNLSDITVRQNIQLHWLTIENLPEIVDALEAVGLSPVGACGDVVRNVTGCPLAGLAADEVIDASPLALEVSRLLSGNSEFYNLPRKFKISITGCPSWCSYPEINDLAFTPARRNGVIGFSLRVGGGLSREPHLAVKLDAFVLPEQVVAVSRAAALLFREQIELRESRERARMKYLFLKQGWDAKRFLDELHARLDFQLQPAGEEVVPADVFRDHTGIHAQHAANLFTVGASVLRGRLSGEQLVAAAALADHYGSGKIRLTVAQNLLFVDIPADKTEQLVHELGKIEFHVEASNFWRGAVSCTGMEFCKLALTETKSFTRWLVEELDARLPGFDQQLRLNVTGCPNGCGQHWIADIGIEGKKIREQDRMIDAYYFCLGGAVGKDSGVARPVGYRCAADRVPDAIERLLRAYLASRNEEENLRAWFARHSDEQLRITLAGEPVEAVERDLPAGRPASGGE